MSRSELKKKTVKELKAMAKALGESRYSALNKDDHNISSVGLCTAFALPRNAHCHPSASHDHTLTTTPALSPNSFASGTSAE